MPICCSGVPKSRVSKAEVFLFVPKKSCATHKWRHACPYNFIRQRSDVPVGSFFQTNLCENKFDAPRGARDFNTLRFSKIVLETIFSNRVIATSCEKKDGPCEGTHGDTISLWRGPSPNALLLLPTPTFRRPRPLRFRRPRSRRSLRFRPLNTTSRVNATIR